MVKIYVGNLAPNVRSSDLREMFERYGRVDECDILNSTTNDFGFVHMSDAKEARDAIAALHDMVWKGSRLRVELSTTRTNKGELSDRKRMMFRDNGGRDQRGNGLGGGNGPIGNNNIGNNGGGRDYNNYNNGYPSNNDDRVSGGIGGGGYAANSARAVDDRFGGGGGGGGGYRAGPPPGSSSRARTLVDLTTRRRSSSRERHARAGAVGGGGGPMRDSYGGGGGSNRSRPYPDSYRSGGGGGGGGGGGSYESGNHYNGQQQVPNAAAYMPTPAPMFNPFPFQQSSGPFDSSFYNDQMAQRFAGQYQMPMQMQPTPQYQNQPPQYY